MHINIKKTITLEVEPTDTICDIKQKIQDSEGVPVDKQRIIIDGKQLENYKTIFDYRIKNNAILNLIIKHKE